MSVSEACAVKAASPITRATAAGPAFRVRAFSVSTGAAGSFVPAADSVGGFSFMFTLDPGIMLAIKAVAIPCFLKTDRSLRKYRQVVQQGL